jgi:hypothetical protein
MAANILRLPGAALRQRQWDSARRFGHRGPLQSRCWAKDRRYTQIERQDSTGARRISFIERYETAPDRRLSTIHHVRISYSRCVDRQTTTESCVNEFPWWNGALFPSRRRISEVHAHEMHTREILLSEHDVLA